MAAPPAVPPERRAEIVGEALAAILEGSSLREIAARYNIDQRTLNRWLLGDVPDKYREIQAQGMIARIVEADENLAEAKDHLAIARCREICKFTRWDAERRLPKLFGQKTELTATVTQVVDIPEAARRLAFILRQAPTQTIDVDPIPDSSPT